MSFTPLKSPTAAAVLQALRQQGKAVTTHELANHMAAYTDIVSTRLCYLVRKGRATKAGKTWEAA